jgi:hypothetical protein
MFLDVHSALQDRFGRVLGQNCKINTTDPKKLAPGSLKAKPSGPVSTLLACWLFVGPVVHSEAFLPSFYNFITPKQHLSNAHNIK